MGKSRAVQQLEHLVKSKLKSDDASETIDKIKSLYVWYYYENDINQIVTSFITKLLSTYEHRAEGLKLLNSIVYKIPMQFVLENYSSWIPLCLQHNDVDALNHLKLQLSVKIIQICNGDQDFDKFLVTILQKLLDKCLSAQRNLNVNVSAMDCINICIEKYPSSCIPFKSKLEQGLIKNITSDQPKNVIKSVGTALHLLQQIPGGANNNKSTNWTNQFNKLCATIHKIYDDFFEGIIEYVSKTEQLVEPFVINGIESSGYNSINHQNKRAVILRNLIIFFNCMLVQRYSYPKTVTIPLVLNVFRRGLMVDTYDVWEESIESMQFTILLYNHQIELLYLLRSFIACFKHNLIPFSSTIVKLIIDCLRRTEKDFFKNNFKYQEAAHKALDSWIFVAQNRLNLSTHNKIVSMILMEITPQNNDVVLSLNKDLVKEQTAKRRRKELTKIMTSQVNTTTTVDESVPKDCLRVKELKCMYALNTCIVLLEKINLYLDDNNFYELFRIVTSTVVLIQTKKIGHPYNNANCVVPLYKVMHAIFHQEKYCVRPLIQIAIKLFTNGQNSCFNQDVSSICINSLHTLEKLCQPLCPSLPIPSLFEKFGDESNLSQEDKRRFKNFINRVSNGTSSDMINSSNIETPNSDPPTIILKSPSPIPSLDILSVPKTPKSDKKINILDVHIIKQPVVAEPNINTKEIDESDVTMKEPDTDISYEAIEFDSHSFTNDRDDDKESPTEGVEFDSHSFTNDRDDDKESPTEEVKVELDDEEEERMLSSFRDIVN
ncbi:hypothetical protein FQR65_LT03600 [Abscondita terminalis]|nr:hypothetical protein FQR65_LT03600 [Abscondita terminalis]